MKHLFVVFLRSLFSFLLMVSLVCCGSRQKEDVQCSDQLIRLDSLLYAHPALVFDSLTRLIPAEMTEANRAYYYLLKSIAEAKMEIPRQSDSLLDLAYHYYSKVNAPGEQARCLLYKGVIRDAANDKDATVFHLLKRSEKILDSSLLDMPQTRIVLYAHLGRMHRIHHNYSLSEKYILKTYKLSHRLNDLSRLVTALIDWYWVSTSTHNFQAAASSFLELTAIDSFPADLEPYIKVIQVHATQSNSLRQEAIKTIQSVGNHALSPSSSRTDRIFQIAKYYHELNLPDSCMHYVEQGLLCLKQDSITPQKATYLYLAADEFAETGQYSEAITLYKEAQIASEQQQQILSTQRIAELEKEYDQAVVLQALFNEKQNKKLLFYIVLGLILITALIIYTVWQYVRTKQKLANEHQKWIEFLRYTFYSTTHLLPDFIRQVNEISHQNKRKPGVEMYDLLQQAIEQAKRDNKEAFTQISQHPCFINLCSYKEMSALSDREKIIYILSEKGFADSVIAGFLGVTQNSIRASRAKINKKKG